MKNTTGDNWTQKVRLSPAIVFNEYYIAVIAKTTCLGSTRRYHNKHTQTLESTENKQRNDNTQHN